MGQQTRGQRVYGEGAGHIPHWCLIPTHVGAKGELNLMGNALWGQISSQ